MPASEFSNDAPSQGGALVPFDGTPADCGSASAAALVPTGSPGATSYGAPAFAVMFICVPCRDAWHRTSVGRDLTASTPGMNFVEAARALTEQLALHPGMGRVVAEIAPRCAASRGTNADALVPESPRSCCESGRALLTLLFTDIVRSTGMVEQLGDGPWRALLVKHNAIVRGQLSTFGGHEVDHAGDGFFATFDRPTHAVRCAECIRGELQTLGIVIRAAIHTAECETGDESVSGLAVHVAARMVSVARPGEIIVSSTVRELVAGSGLSFSNGEWHTLRGLSESRQLFALQPSPSRDGVVAW